MEKIPDFLIQLTDGLSVHVKSATRYWLALALISVITITSTIPVEPKNEKEVLNIALPFNLGKINKVQYYPFSAALISLLIISAPRCFMWVNQSLIWPQADRPL